MKIYINGGLGNQLFQWAHMHFLLKKLNEIPVIWKDQNPRNDRPFELEDLLGECTHFEGVSTINGGLRPLLRKLSKLLKLRIYQQYEILREPREFEFSDLSMKANNKSLIQGYFQNWQYVESVWDVIGDELNRFILNLSLPNLYIDKRPMVILHIRRGDFKLQSSTFGLLDINYYLTSLDFVRSSSELEPFIVVITDDVDSASKLIHAIEPDQVLTPADASAWQCLGLMNSAKFVIAANSTLSWWGSYLCSKSGGTSIIPSPWFKDFSPSAGESFSHPDFVTMKSSFE
jgi:hypothetical protein